MGWKENSSAAFSGGSGQMAVIGELLHRKCNAAVPHIDVGTDVFAFRDDRPEVARIQVKTEAGAPYSRTEGYSARFGVPMKQLDRADDPPLFYVLVVRLDGGWGSFIVISRTRLKELWDRGCGSANRVSGDLELHIQFRPAEEAGENQPRKPTAKCGAFDLTDCIDAWDALPPLKPPPPITAEELGAAGADGAATQPPQA